MKALFADLYSLTKPRLSGLVIGTTAVGLFLAPVRPSSSILLWSLLGTTLLVGASNALNMYLERDIDALMLRTKNRPLPAGRLQPKVALFFGIILTIIAIGILFSQVNRLTGFLGIIAAISYLLFYTPLKQRSHTAILVGAIPGAIPPLIGWTASTGDLSPPGWILFLILFLWQIPHSLAIALMHKEEYQKAGIRVLPLEKGEQVTKHWIVRYTFALTAISLYPVLYGMVGKFYLIISLLLGGGFLFQAFWGFKKESGRVWARRFFLFSILYLPLLLIALLAGKTF